jgi:hypothetical protein
VILDTITKTVSIDAPPAKVFYFLADARNLKWAIINVKSIAPGRRLVVDGYSCRTRQASYPAANSKT